MNMNEFVDMAQRMTPEAKLSGLMEEMRNESNAHHNVAFYKYECKNEKMASHWERERACHMERANWLFDDLMNWLFDDLMKMVSTEAD